MAASESENFLRSQIRNVPSSPDIEPGDTCVICVAPTTRYVRIEPYEDSHLGLCDGCWDAVQRKDVAALATHTGSTAEAIEFIVKLTL